jgi:hypothetical protein
MQITSIGIDLGKTTFHLVALGPLRGRIHLRRLSLRSTLNLLQSGGGPYIFSNCTRRPPIPTHAASLAR